MTAPLNQRELDEEDAIQKAFMTYKTERGPQGAWNHKTFRAGWYACKLARMVEMGGYQKYLDYLTIKRRAEGHAD